MIDTVDDFYNKVVDEITEKFFTPEDVKNYTENYRKAKYAVELFNNGALNYRKLIGRVAKACKVTTKPIHEIVEKYVISFGSSYEYQPSKK